MVPFRANLSPSEPVRRLDSWLILIISHSNNKLMLYHFELSSQQAGQPIYLVLVLIMTAMNIFHVSRFIENLAVDINAKKFVIYLYMTVRTCLVIRPA
jgi:hypothetical protein